MIKRTRNMLEVHWLLVQLRDKIINFIIFIVHIIMVDNNLSLSIITNQIACEHFSNLLFIGLSLFLHGLCLSIVL